jgi:hypothetical protein
LNRVAKSHPKTVEEVLLARGGPDAIAHDLQQLVRGDVGLTKLEYLLDFLAERPGESSDAAVEASLDAYLDNSVPHFPTRFPGKERRPAHGASVAEDDRLPPELTEAEASLPRIAVPVRVYLGSDLEAKLIAGGNLKPEVLEGLYRLRAELRRHFGVTTPGVRFHGPSHTPEIALNPDQYRIEMFNQGPPNEDAMPVQVKRDPLTEILQALKLRLVILRTWLLSSDATNRHLEALPKNLRAWLAQRYTLTDIKLLLQAQIAPSGEERLAYPAYNDEDAFGLIQPEQTVDELPWLLGALLFQDSNDDRDTDFDGTVKWLRRVQQARLTSRPETRYTGEAVELIRQGVAKLADDRIDEASRLFTAAASIKEGDPRATFASLYADISHARSAQTNVGKLCKLPEPGRVAKASPPSDSERFQIERRLSEAGYGARSERVTTMPQPYSLTNSSQQGPKGGQQRSNTRSGSCYLNSMATRRACRPTFPRLPPSFWRASANSSGP